jgi:hypothetical protein
VRVRRAAPGEQVVVQRRRLVAVVGVRASSIVSAAISSAV